MDRAGEQMTVEFKDAHLEWGTKSADGTRNRSEYETYIQIPAHDARRLELERGLCFHVLDTSFKIASSGNGPQDGIYGKQFHSKGNLQLLGQYLKDELGAQQGDEVTVTWESNTEVSITVQHY